MKFITFTFVFASMILSNSLSHAGTSEIGFIGAPVTIEPLRDLHYLELVGKGVQNRKTSEGIVLSCDPETCTTYRFVYVDENKNAFYLGNAFKMDADALNKKLRSIKREIRRGQILTGDHIIIYFVAVAVATMVGIYLVPIAGASVVTGVSAGLIFPPFFAIGLTQKSSLKGIGNFSLTNQNGWNWSVEPKKISKNTFAQFKKRIIENFSAQ